MKIGLISLGCSKNLYDSEMMLGLIKKNNLVITNNMAEADIIIVNTCGFIESAKQEAIDTILEVLEYKKSKNTKIVVTGCLATRYIEVLKKEIPEVDLFISISDYNQFGTLFANLLGIRLEDNSLSPTNRLLSTPNHWAYLRIADGCDNCCTYCAIPLIRKKYVSRKLDDVLLEAKGMLEKGIKEIVLISQDTTRFGYDYNNGVSLLPKLLQSLAEELKFPIIRFLYTYPDELSDELLEVVAKHPNICPYFDVPIQHASTKVLTRMNRRGNNQFLDELFEKIKNKVNNAVLRTTIIVGFPGESDEDFNILKDFIKKVEFDRLGVFMYSKEEDTASFNYIDQIDEEVKIKRYNELMKLQQKIAYKKNQKYLGSIQSVIIDKYDEKVGHYVARNYALAPDDIDGVIYITTEKKLEVGQIVEVKINQCLVHDLLASC